MMEDLALRYSELSEQEMRAISYMISVVGGLLAWLLGPRQEEPMHRVAYLLGISVVFLLVSIPSLLISGLVVGALKSETFWVLLVAEALTTMMGGFAMALLAQRRSFDAYSHAGRAFLAFIPLANLVLIFASPNGVNLKKKTLIENPFLGIPLALVLLAASISISSYAQVEGGRRVAEAAERGEFIPVMLDRMLVELANGVETPIRYDEVTVLTSVTANETTILYTYEVSSDITFIPARLKLSTTRMNCENTDLAPYIDAGATIHHDYNDASGKDIGDIIVNRTACGR